MRLIVGQGQSCARVDNRQKGNVKEYLNCIRGLGAFAVRLLGAAANL